MQDQESTPIHGGIVANDCGTGKTLTCWGLIYAQAMAAKEDISIDEYQCTLIICPAPLVSQWIECAHYFYPGKFKISQFYGTPDSVAVERKGMTLRGSSHALDEFLDSLSPKDPEVT